MKTFYGIVEDRQDPLKIGRVRVRVHGAHTHEKDQIATPDLPWAQVILPTTEAGLSGFGRGNGLVEGSTVFGFWRDEEIMQDPVVLGVAVGIPAQGSRITVQDELIKRKIEDGFNDPRRLTVEDYKDTPDGETPTHDRARTFGLTTALDSAPKQPKALNLTYQGEASTISEVTLTDDDLPYYPKYYDASDLDDGTTGTALYTTRKEWKIIKEGVPDEELLYLNTKEIFTDNTKKRIVEEKWTEDFPVTKAAPVYPYNKSITTESGHIIEVDDTLGAERLSIEHRSGTFHEIHPDGSQVTRIVNNNYQVVAKDNKVIIGGDVDLTVEKGNVRIAVTTGNADIYVAGSVDLMVDKNINATVGENLTASITGTTDVTSEGKITITGNDTTEIISDTTVTGTLHVTGAQTNDSTITATESITGKEVVLDTHTHTESGGSKTKKPD